MPTPKNEEIKIRVPLAMKAQVQALAESRLSSESAIVREALLAYLERHAAGQLREASAPYGPSGASADATPADISRKAVEALSKRYPSARKRRRIKP